MLRASIDKPTVFLKRDIKHIWIGNYNPWIAKTMNSNMNIQFIIDEVAYVSYMMRYNKYTSCLHRELLPNDDDDNTIEMSSQEAAWYLLKLGMTKSSRKVEYIPTVWPCERNEGNVIEKYENRSEDLFDISLAQFAAAAASRRRRKIIRYRNYNNETIDYKREMVTLFYPFRNEHVDILDRNAFIQIYDMYEGAICEAKKKFFGENGKKNIAKKKCFGENGEKNIAKKKCVGENGEKNIAKKKCVGENGKKNIAPTFPNGIPLAFSCRDIVEKVSPTVAQSPLFENHCSMKKRKEKNPRSLEECCCSVRQMNKQIPPAFSCRDIVEKVSPTVAQSPLFENHCSMKKRQEKNPRSLEEFCCSVRQMNKQQKYLVFEVIDSIITQKTLRLFLSGPAGTGKTFTLKLLMEACNMFSLHDSKYNAYISSASTGIAACTIKGSTIHTIFNISTRRKTVLSPKTVNNFRLAFQGVEMIFVDEVSMIGHAMLSNLNSRLQQIADNYDEPFGNFNIIFCGDMFQLSPVCQTPVYRRIGSKNTLWQWLDYYPLEQVERQKMDKTFLSILNKLRHGEKCTREEKRLLEGRFITVQEAEKYVHITHLFRYSKDVRKYNRYKYLKETAVACIAIDSGKSHKADIGGLPYILKLCIGKSYMLKVNIDISDGLANGQIGILRHFDHQYLWMEFSDSGVGTNARLKCQEQFPSNWIPIQKQISREWVAADGWCKRIQFPLVEAGAMTIHKSQGRTFTDVIVDYDKSYSLQLVYVALSRVISLNGLFLVNKNDDFTFYHCNGQKGNRELHDELLRLKKHQFHTYASDCEKFLTSEKVLLSLVDFNVCGLQNHKLDIELDEVLTKAEILVLTETGNTEIIKNYMCTAQCVKPSGGGVAIFDNAKRASFVFANSDDKGDVCVVVTNKILIIGVFLAPGIGLEKAKRFLTENISETKQPTLLTGNFNIDLLDNNEFVHFMKETLRFNLVPYNRPATTKDGRCLDGVFTKNIIYETEAKTFVSYFSNHHPLLFVIYGRT